VEAGRRLQMSQTTIAKWQKKFLEGARESLARGRDLGRLEPNANRSCRPGWMSWPRRLARPTSSCGPGAKGGSLPTFING